jgi:UPF0755 protein
MQYLIIRLPGRIKQMSDYRENFEDTLDLDFLGSFLDKYKLEEDLDSAIGSLSSGNTRIEDDDLKFWNEYLSDCRADSYEFGEEMSMSYKNGAGRRYESRAAKSSSSSALSDRTRTSKSQYGSRSRGYERDDEFTKKIDIKSAATSQRAGYDYNRRGNTSGRGGKRSSGGKPPRRGLVYRLFHLSGLSYFLFVIIISGILAVSGWIFANDVFALNKEPHTAIVNIPEDFTIGDVASELKEAGIIEYKWLFKLFSTIANAKEKIDPGSYELNTDLDYRAIISKMHFGASAGPDDIVEVTLPEGQTMYEIFETLEKYGVCKASALLEVAANYDFEYDFLDPSTLGNESRLEGYLFPDTYELYLDDEPEDVIIRFLNNFRAKVTEEMYERAQELGYTMDQIIIIASLIEKETSGDDESPYISSVIYNRLNSSAYPYLQIDATIQYVLPERKDKLSDEDIAIDSPYNTYKYEGLPPTPIANPGLASIEAALYPADTDYYFYALHKDGYHEFFTNSDDFDEFVNGEYYGG